MKRSQRLDLLPAYPLAGIPEAKRRLLAAGHDVIDLGAGEAIVPPPAEAVAELRVALDDPHMSRYGFQLGYVPFREAAVAYMERRFGVSFDPLEEILPLLGSKDGLAHLALAVTDPGDRVVVPEPGHAATSPSTDTRHPASSRFLERATSRSSFTPCRRASA
jgi:aspartate/methionine/tyrosine aminotransferase